MPDNNILFSVTLPDGTKTTLNEEQYAQAQEKLFSKFPDAQVARVSSYVADDNDQQESDSYSVQLPDGTNTVLSSAQFIKNRDSLLEKFPDAQIAKVSDMSDRYWRPKLEEAQAALNAFNQEHGQAMNQYETYEYIAQQSEQGEIPNFNSPSHKWLREHDAEYQPLKKQRAALSEAVYNNPIIRRGRQQAHDQAIAAREEYLELAKNAKSGAERRDYKRAAKLQGDAAKMFAAPGQYDAPADGENGFIKYMEDYKRGAGATFSDRDFWTRGLTQIARDIDLYGIRKKVQDAEKAKGGPLDENDYDRIISPSEKAQLFSFYNLARAQVDRANDLSSAYKAGNSAAESLGFMAEFLLSQGLANVAGKALSASTNGFARWMGQTLMSEKALGRAIEKGITAPIQMPRAARIGTEIARPIVQGLWHTGTQLSTLSSIASMMNQTNDKGELNSVGRGIWLGFADSLVENWSESFGNTIDFGMEAVGKGLGWTGNKILGKTTFGQAARWALHSPFAQTLKEAGFNGFFGEMMEEWAGNAVRLATGLMDKDEFKQFASIEQQLEMAASFAPMSLFGLAGNVVSGVKYKKEYDRLLQQTKDILLKNSVPQAEIDAIFNKKWATTDDIAAALAPYAQRVLNNEGSTAKADYKTILDFAKMAGADAFNEAVNEYQDEQRRGEMREAIQAQIGRQFWTDTDVMDEKTDKVVRTESSVRVVTDIAGNTYFVMSGDEQCVLGVSTVDGSTSFLFNDQIASDNTSSLNDYLQSRVEATDKDAEAKRMYNELQQNLAAVRQRIAENPTFDMGTPEAPKIVTVYPNSVTNEGLQVTYKEDGQNVITPMMSWKDVAGYLGMPFEPQTDAQMAEAAAAAQEQAAARKTKYNNIPVGTQITVTMPGAEGDEQVPYRFAKAIYDENEGSVRIYVADENGQIMTDSKGDEVWFPEEMVQGLDAIADQAIQQKNTPAPVETETPPAPVESQAPVARYTNEAGKVNQTAFMKNEPEEWAKWNDERRQDGGASSKERLAAAIGELEKEINELNKKKAATANPDDADAIEENVNGLAERYGRLKAIFDGYVAREKAAKEAEDSAKRAEFEAAAAAKKEAEKKAAAKIQDDLKEDASFVELAETYANQPKTYGDKDTYNVGGRKFKGRWVVAEATTPKPSHNPLNDFAPTPGYPIGKAGNSNHYDKDKRAQEITREMSNPFDERAVQEPVVVTKHGIVLSGNGRTQARLLAAQQQTDAEYREYVREHASKWGLTAEQVDAYANPILYFELEEDVEYTAALFDAFNRSTSKQQSATETAAKVAQMSSEELVMRLDRLFREIGDSIDNLYKNPEKVNELLNMLQAAGIFNANERARYVDEYGNLSGAGEDLVESVLFGTIFDTSDDAVRAAMNDKAVRRAVTFAFPTLVRLRNLNGELSLIGELTEAVSLLSQAKAANNGKAENAVIDYMLQGNLWTGETPIVKATVQLLANVLNDGKYGSLRAVLNQYIERAEAANYGQAIFTDEGTIEVETKERILRDVLAHNKINIETYGNTAAAQQGVSTNDEVRPADSEQGSSGAPADGTGETNPVGVQGEGSPATQVEKKSSIQGLEHLSEKEITDQVYGHLGELAMTAGSDGFRIKKITIIGSRANGTARADSDLDVLVEYEGDMAESDVFNAVNGEPLVIDGIRVDINPINTAKSGTTEQWLKAHPAEAKPAAQQEGPVDVLQVAKEQAERVKRLKKRVAKWKKFLGDSFAIAEGIKDIEKIEDAGTRQQVLGRQQTEGDVEGWFDTKTGKAVIYLPNIPDEKTLDRKIIHEVLSHKGIRGMLGEERFAMLCDYVWGQMGEEDRSRYLNYPGVVGIKDLQARQRAAADEYFAHESERRAAVIAEQTIDADFWTKVGEFVKNFINDAVGEDLLMTAGELGEMLKDAANYVRRNSPAAPESEETGALFSVADKRGLPLDEYNKVIDALFNDPSFNRDEHSRERYNFGETPEWMKTIGLTGDNITLSFKNIREHYGKDSDHALTADEWKMLPDAVKTPFLVTKYKGQNDKFRLYTGIIHNGKFVVAGVDVVKVNQGKNAPMLEVNRIKTAFGINGGISPSETIVTYDETITPEQEALLRGLNYREYPSIQELSANKGSESSSNAQVSDIKNDEQEGTVLFSVKGNKGEKSLIGIHNISARKIAAAVKTGGLANPSMAVIDLSFQKHEDFGEISLIAPSSLIDSETGRNAGTYTGDAWTPTYPGVSKQMSDKGWDKFWDDVRDLPYPFDTKTRNDWREYLEDDRMGRSLRWWFLQDTGRNPEIIHHSVNLSDADRELFKSLEGKERHSDVLLDEELWPKVVDLYKRLGDPAEVEHAQQKVPVKEGRGRFTEYLEARNREVDDWGIWTSPVFNLVESLQRELRRGGQVAEIATYQAADKFIEDNNLQDAFDQWLQAKEKEYGVKSVLFAGWTRDGDKKYVPNTVENASRLMNQEPEQNSYGNGGVNATRSLLLDRMESLSEIRKNRGLLGAFEGYASETDEYKEATDNWFNVIDALAQKQKVDDNQFINIDIAESRLQEAIQQRDPIAYLNREYRYGLSKDGEFAEALKASLKEIKALPAKYFETKFNRPVYLNEFAAAVVPSDTRADVRKELEKAGLPIYEYDSKVEGSRKESVLKASEADGIRFSVGGEQSRFSPAVQREMDSIKAAAQADGTFMKAPNGKATNLSEEQWLLVRTPNFLRYFGDWINDPAGSSKILDNNGEPAVVFHGSSWNPESEEPGQAVFDDSFRGTGSGDNGFFGRGFYFTYGPGMKDARRAEAGYYGRNITQAFLNIRNPFMFKETLEKFRTGKDNYGSERESVLILNMVKNFPELVKDYRIDVIDSEGDISGEITLEEYAKIFEDTYNNKEFIIEEGRDERDKNIVELCADPVHHTETINGQVIEWDDYGFRMPMYRPGANEDAQLAYTHYYLTYLQDFWREDHKGVGYSFPSHMFHNLFESEEFTQAIKDKGYDGVLQSADGDEAVAFKAKQIKSATGNKGEYSEHNPDIRFSIDNFNPVRTDQTQTKAFKDWFKGSKVVDENGNPLVVYRGADYDPLAQEPGMGVIKPQRYFSPSKEYAQRYGLWTREYYLNIQHPFDVRNKKDAAVLREFLPEGYEFHVGSTGALDWAELSAFDLDELIEAHPEYDGMIFDEGGEPNREGGVSYRGVSFMPFNGGAQVKSATSNNGEYSPANPDVRFSVRQYRNFVQAQQEQKVPGREYPATDIRFSLSRNNRQTIEAWLRKRTDLSQAQRDGLVRYLDSLDNPTLQLATAKWFAQGVIRLPEDMDKVEQAVSVSRKAKVDPLQYASPMELLEAHAEFEATQKRINPDKVSTLHRAQEYKEQGIVIYDVDDTEESRQNMRKIINSHFGKEASPWCLLQGDGNGNLTKASEQYWREYSSYPKQVAFKDGKLLAFSANDSKKRLWWDRQDRPHEGVPVSMKMPNDALGRSATYEYNPQTGELGEPTDIHRGNKQNGTYETWTEDGKTQLTREQYKDGKRHGLVETWHRSNGKRWVRATYNNGKEVKYESWWENGNPWIVKQADSEGRLQGEQLEYHENGQLAQRWNYKDGKWDGLKERWSRDGILVERTEFKDGRRHGTEERWFDTGKKMSITHYDNSQKHGLMEEWYWNGNKRSEINYDHDFRVGTSKTWHESGNPKSVAHFNENGDADGVTILYHDKKDAIFTREHWKGGERHGLSEQFWPNGQQAIRENWSNGKRDGLSERWFDNGILAERKTYTDGKENGVKEMWDSGGKLWYRHEMVEGKEGRFLGTSPNESVYGDVRFSVVTDKAELERLEKEPTVTLYRAMELIDGELYPPMSQKVPNAPEDKGKRLKKREGVKPGMWQKSDEDPAKAYQKEPGGPWYYDLKKNSGSDVNGVLYNPYLHLSASPLNDQFSAASTRPNLVVVACEVPISELSSGYKAEKANDSVGAKDWHSGTVTAQLGEGRQVVLSRWAKIGRIVPDGEVAAMVAPKLVEKNIVVPTNVVTPSLRDALEVRGVKFAEPEGSEGDVRFSVGDNLPVQGRLFDMEGNVVRYQSEGGLPQQEGRTSYVERTYRKRGDFSFMGKDKIKTVGDVAFIFKELETSAVENSFIVYVKDGVPTILHTGIGNIEHTTIDESAFVAGLNDFAPDTVYIVHNHPSGRVEASRADVSMLEVLQRVAGNVPVKGVIIDTLSGQYGEFSYNSFPNTKVHEASKENEGYHPLEVQSFDKMVFRPEYRANMNHSLINAKEVAAFLSAHRLGKGPKVGALLLNNAMNVVGNLVLNENEITNANAKELARQVVNAAVHSSANHAILFGDFGYNKISVAVFRSELGSLSANKIGLTDVVRVEGNNTRSLADGTLADSASARFSVANNHQRTFISNAAKAAEEAKMEKATPQQWLKMIEGKGGLKAGEDKWIGLSDWLKSQDKKTLTKQEVQNFIAQSQIRIEDANYSNNAIFSKNSLINLESEIKKRGNASIESVLQAWDREFNDSKLVQYQQGYFSVNEDNEIVFSQQLAWPINSTRLKFTSSGLKNKREIALVVPTVEPYNQYDEIHFGDAGYGRAIAWVRFGDAVDAETGDRVLFIDEIQSKRHQDAREKGYVSSPEEEFTYRAKLKALSELEEFTRAMEQKYGKYNRLDQYSEEDNARYHQLHNAVNAATRANEEERAKLTSAGVPAAPFERNWHELAMKRMLRLAAEEGYAYVAWTTGEQQAERYNIGKVIDQVSKARTFDTGETRYDLMPKDDSGGISLFVKDGVVTRSSLSELEGKPLPDVVGKELANKMLEMEDNSSLDIKEMSVGGEGMHGFYDEILPRFMNKYGKKWGAAVESERLVDASGILYPAHVVPVTEEMKQSVMQGQVMFSVRSADEAQQSGMAGVIGQENVGEFYMELYRQLPTDMRGEITDKAMSGNMNFREATEEYLSDLAARGNDTTGLLRMAENLLSEYAGDVLTDNVAQYILWRGDKGVNNNDLLDVAHDQFMRNRLDVETPQVRFSVKEEVTAADAAAEAAVDEASDELKKGRKEIKDLLTMAKAMGLQKVYDKKTVEAVTNLSKQLLKDQYIDQLSRREVSRLLGIVRTSVGRAPKTVKKNADAIVEMVIEHLLRREREGLKKLTSNTGSKTNATGVEVQGSLDVQGQKIMKAYREGLKLEVGKVDDGDDANTLYGMRARIQSRLSSKDDAVRKEAEAEDQGLALAIEYKEGIKALQDEEKSLQEDLKDAAAALRDKDISKTGYDEFVRATEDAIRENHIEQIEAHREFRTKMQGVLSGSSEAKKSFMEREKERVENIYHLANSDMQGRSASKEKRPGFWDKLANSPIVRFFAAPLATFDQMLRLFGEKSINGEGYLYNKFMRGWLEAAERAYIGQRDAKAELDRKASEVFGRDMLWSDIYDEEHKMPTVTVKWWDDGKMTEHELSQGQLLYIYMVNKMADGRMKLRKMGIDEETVEAIKGQMDKRFLELADWLQDEYLVNLRNKYNAVHERLFGASMAAIENYFPLKINKRDLNRNEDISAPDYESLPSTTTGSIIKRRRNSKALDLLNADAFSVVIEHIDQMEQWAAFAEFNKDVNALLSYKRFRNQVQNMASVYGSGTTLWHNFKDVMRIAGNAYHPQVGRNQLDTAAVNLAKGVTSAKISFRMYTALKQFLSLPAFVADANVGYLAKNMVTPWKAWNWAMENLPVFEKRWKSRIAGDTRLMSTEADWKVFRTKMYDTLSRLGMTPNAFVDAVTVAIGARSMYETRYARYIKEGFSEEEADKKAKQDATILYNETQQSNENAFVSAAQLDRTMFSTAITVFRNSSMGFQRQVHDAVRNLGKHFKKGYKEQSIEFMTKQLVREGLSEEQAAAAAERRYNRSIMRDSVRLATFGFLVEFAWNLGGSIAYLLFGDDDGEKEKMLMEAFKHALIGGSMEGLAGGNVMSDALNMVAKGENLRNYDPALLPILSDMKRTYAMMSYDPVAGSNELFNLAVQAGIGVNPQTLEDAVVAVVDACNGDMETSREAMLLIMRVLQVPQSQIDQIYIDELGVKASTARRMSPTQMAKRYADYKLMRNAGKFTPLYTEELEKKRKASYEKSFKKKLKERKEGK